MDGAAKRRRAAEIAQKMRQTIKFSSTGNRAEIIPLHDQLSQMIVQLESFADGSIETIPRSFYESTIRPYVTNVAKLGARYSAVPYFTDPVGQIAFELLGLNELAPLMSEIGRDMLGNATQAAHANRPISSEPDDGYLAEERHVARIRKTPGNTPPHK